MKIATEEGFPGLPEAIKLYTELAFHKLNCNVWLYRCKDNYLPGDIKPEEE